MSRLIEPSALWQALQDVDDGQDPADVYAKVMSEAEDPAEAIDELHIQDAEEAHNDDACRHRHSRSGLGWCPGTKCIRIDGARLTVECPCNCHAHDPD